MPSAWTTICWLLWKSRLGVNGIQYSSSEIGFGALGSRRVCNVVSVWVMAGLRWSRPGEEQRALAPAMLGFYASRDGTRSVRRRQRQRHFHLPPPRIDDAHRRPERDQDP